MAATWEELARQNQVYPLDEGTALKYLVRPTRSAVYSQPVRIVAGTPTLERWRSVQLIWFRGVEFRVELGDEGFATGDRGVLLAHGDQGSGYVIYVENDTLRYAHNDGRGHVRHLSGGPIPVGCRELVCRKEALGGGVWSVTLEVDGEQRSSLEDVPLLYGMAPFEGMTVGRDPRSPVVWDLHEREGSFAFTGQLEAVTVTPGDHAPDSPVNMVNMLREIGLKYE
jgi:arylsulfatase